MHECMGFPPSSCSFSHLKTHRKERVICMSITKYLYLVMYKVPFLDSENWSIENITLYAKDAQELEEKISRLPAHHNPMKTLLQAEKMPYGFSLMQAWFPPTIEVEEKIPV